MKKLFFALMIVGLLGATFSVFAQTLPAEEPSVAQPAPEPVVETVAPADTTGPIIADVSAQSLISAEATIMWTTDELATSTLRYGTTTSYGSTALVSGSAATVHTTTLVGLAAATTYFYCIDATDVAGNVSQSCGHSFVTADEETPSDTKAPVITEVSVSSVTKSSAVISWTTDEVADSFVEYGATPDYGMQTSIVTDYSTDHAATLSGLAPGTEYYYRVVSSDALGNTATSSGNNFTTLTESNAPVPEPEPNPIVTEPADTSAIVDPAVISGVEVIDITAQGVTVSWTTNVPADSQIVYGDSTALGSSTPIDEALKTVHMVTIDGLIENTAYYFNVRSKPAGATVATTSAFHDFTTLAVPTETVAPAEILSVSADVEGSTAATISAVTDKQAIAHVEYGITTGYGQITQSSASDTYHSFNLASLAPDTTYEYRIVATDDAGNVTYSENFSFTTSAASVSGGGSSSTAPDAPAPITMLAIGSTRATSATLSWHVPSAQSDTAWLYDIRYSMAPITAANFDATTQADPTLVVYPDVAPNGTARSYTIPGLLPGTTYYFALKSKFEESDYSDISNVVSATLPKTLAVPSVPLDAPLLIDATGIDDQNIFLWQNPQSVSFVGSVIIRKSGSFPLSPLDGTVIYDGNGETFTDTGVVNGIAYYYAIYSYDESKQYSPPIHVKLAPVASPVRETVSRSGGGSSRRSSIGGFAIETAPDITDVSPREHFVAQLTSGDKGVEVRHLQRLLDADGHFPSADTNIIDGIFGPATKAALLQFQNAYNLPETGVTSPRTREKLNVISQNQVKLSVPDTIRLADVSLTLADKGDAVVALQKFLAHEGVGGGLAIDGQYGRQTAAAVKSFQLKYGITPVDGHFGPITRHRARSISGR